EAPRGRLRGAGEPRYPEACGEHEGRARGAAGGPGRGVLPRALLGPGTGRTPGAGHVEPLARGAQGVLRAGGSASGPLRRGAAAPGGGGRDPGPLRGRPALGGGRPRIPRPGGRRGRTGPDHLRLADARHGRDGGGGARARGPRPGARRGETGADPVPDGQPFRAAGLRAGRRGRVRRGGAAPEPGRGRGQRAGAAGGHGRGPPPPPPRLGERAPLPGGRRIRHALSAGRARHRQGDHPHDRGSRHGGRAPGRRRGVRARPEVRRPDGLVRALPHVEAALVRQAGEAGGLRGPQGSRLRGLHLPLGARIRPGARSRARRGRLRHVPGPPGAGLSLPRPDLHRGGVRRGRPAKGGRQDRGRPAWPDRRHRAGGAHRRSPGRPPPPPLLPRRGPPLRREAAHGLRRLEHPRRPPGRSAGL
ncbi:MAG: Light-independent protochlorophyllide reductase subunit B, partial [uncultured Rubrobacteraceae bacterium]